MTHAPATPPAPVGPGSYVQLHLEIYLQDGTLALSAWGDDALTLTLGDGTLAPGLEALLVGLTPGVEARVLASGEDLYGPHDPDNIHWLPRSDFPPEMAATPGQVIAFETPGGHELAGLVLASDPQRVQVDLNHPLAGRSLNIRLLMIVPAAPIRDPHP